MDDAVEKTVEAQMIQRADAFIDEMIPPEGMDTWGEPEGGGFFGLGQSDLDAAGSDAFAGMLGEAMDLDSTSAFNGMSGWNPFKKVNRKLRSFVQSRKRVAKKALKKVAGAHKKALGTAKNLVRKSRLTKNVFQKQRLMRGARGAAGQAAKLANAGKKLAKDIVNPKISRAEARVAMRPAVKEMAKKVAASGKAVISSAAKIASKVPGGKKALAVAAKSGELQKKIASGIQKGVAKAIVSSPKKVVREPLVSRLKRMSTRRAPARRAPARKAAPRRSWWSRTFGGRQRRSGMRGLGEYDLEQAVAMELERSGMGSMMYFQPYGSGAAAAKDEGEAEGIYVAPDEEDSMIPSEEPTSTRDIVAEEDAGEAQGATGFLSIGDMNTATQDPEEIDIVDDWASEEAFGDPSGVF